MADQDVVRPDPHLVARLGRIATGTLANALDDLGLHANVPTGIRPVGPGMRFHGPAVTAVETVEEYGRYTSEDFRVGAMIDAAAQGDVIVVAAGGAPCSTWGGMASLAASVKGVAGLVVDGGVRDLEEILDSGLGVCARHLVPTSGRGRLKVEAINVPVEIAGVRVEPGDVVVADGTGVVCVPARRGVEIADIAERLAADDAEAAAEIRKGLTFSEALRRFHRL